MTNPARFWAVDLHVHTPGSDDAREEDYGSADDIVSAAIKARLDAIAVTDHNTADWCDALADAAADTDLIVLPGVEISTTEGHLLGIWEQGTGRSVIEDVLVECGIKTADRGRMDVATSIGLAEAAERISDAGGVAIAAHADRRRGVLKTISVAAHLKATLLSPHLTGLEVFDLATRDGVEAKLAGERVMGFVQGSDTWDKSLSRHALSGIGARRTWIKASRPDLVGLSHALADPELRTATGAAPPVATYPVIQSVEITGGFLNGERLTLCADLNCLLGGTGAGKSLVLEAIRYTMDQQVDRDLFPTIHREVSDRLEAALGLGAVKLELAVDGRRYRVDRPFTPGDEAAPTVYQESRGEWAEISASPSDLVTLAAFSQGEVLEYSRRPVGRMSLVDAGIDLSGIESEITDLTDKARQNADNLLAARQRVVELRGMAGREAHLAEQVRQLSDLFDTDVVKQQEGWAKERGRLTRASNALGELEAPTIKLPSLADRHEVDDNRALFDEAWDVLNTLRTRLDAATSDISEAIRTASEAIQGIRAQWQSRYDDFQAQLDAELEKIDGQSSLASLRTHLSALQEELAESRAAKDELTTDAVPQLTAQETAREELLEALQEARKRRRELRRGRVHELSAKTTGAVRLDVPVDGDFEDYRKALGSIKVGSRVRDDVLDAIAKYTHPLRFARDLWQQRLTDLADDKHGIDLTSVTRLQANIDDKDLWPELLDLQLVDRPDVLEVKFKKPDDGTYTAIENVAHGQRCTAILIILLADGDTPVIVDQPEDALHAPWIEDNLVDRLRALRGSRQYIFATRSPGIVVSSDAEQIITMRATAGHGEVEASGSLERHDLNRQALYHLEGGPIPFNRRTQKLNVSTSQR